MNLEDFIQRVVVIDNMPDEANAIKDALEKKDIVVDTILVDQYNNQYIPYRHSRQIIFADLLLDENINNLVPNISRLIGILDKIQGKCFEPYGIVLWTKHGDQESEFLLRLNHALYGSKKNTNEQNESDDERVDEEISLSNPPLFVICLSKNKYCSSNGEWNFENVLKDINENISKSNSASFFLTWYKTIQDACSKVIHNIYNLSNNYEEHEAKITYLLMKLAQNETASKNDRNLTIGAYKAFDKMLNSELSNLVRDVDRPDFSQFTGKPYGTDIVSLQAISAKLNEKLFIDIQCLNQEEICPGNIYKVMEENSSLRVDKKLTIKCKKNNKFKNSNNYPCIYVAIELTPPCDFVNKKVYSRLVGGYIFNIPLGNNGKNLIFSPQHDDKTYILSPINIPDDDNVKAMVFDFRYLCTPPDEDIKDKTKFKLIFKATPPLFADILQKFSSHASRLGINNINLAEDGVKELNM